MSGSDASSKGSSSPPESNASSKSPSSTSDVSKPSSLKAVGRGIMLSIVIGAHIVLIPTGLFAVWLILRKEYYTVMTKGKVSVKMETTRRGSPRDDHQSASSEHF